MAWQLKRGLEWEACCAGQELSVSSICYCGPGPASPHVLVLGEEAVGTHNASWRALTIPLVLKCTTCCMRKQRVLRQGCTSCKIRRLTVLRWCDQSCSLPQGSLSCSDSLWLLGEMPHKQRKGAASADCGATLLPRFCCALLI